MLLAHVGMDTPRDTAIRPAANYKNEAKLIAEINDATGALRPEIRGMSRYSWGRPRVLCGANHDGARSALAAPS